MFSRPLWLTAAGKRRLELSLLDIFSSYRQRFDIEHFFRFGKNRLLMDKIQTPDVRHEEAWWQIVMIAYAQLYLARSLANSLPNPWEIYLRSFSECCANNLDSIVNYDRSDSGGLGLGHALGPVLDRFFVQSPVRLYCHSKCAE